MNVHNVMYNNRGNFLVLSLEDLSSYKTLFSIISTNKRSKEHNLLIAMNMCKGVAELHSMNIVHGDLASENILVNAKTSEIKIIDFDLANAEGTKIFAAGNCDFVSDEMNEAI